MNLSEKMNTKKNEFLRYECETTVQVTTAANRDLFIHRPKEATVQIQVSSQLI